MATYRFNPNEPIPNDPFYYPTGDSLPTAAGPLIIGSGLTVNYLTSTITATGGGGGGGPVLVVSPITNVGTTTAPVIGIQNATTGQLGAVRIGTNISALNGVISVASATTQNPGIVQLNNTTASTSILEALTAKQGRLLQLQINALTTADNLELAGTFDAFASEMVTVSNDGSSVGFVVAANLPFPDPSITDYFVIVSEAGVYTPPGSAVPFDTNVGDWLLCDGTTWQHLAIGLDIPYATETTPGIIELATLAEVQAGIDAIRAVTPATLVGNFINTCTLTAKGDIVAATAASVPTALAVGADGTVLTACAAAPAGLVWSASLPAIPCACITAKGALISGSAAGLPSTLDVGTNCQQLTANSACPLGLEWKSYTNTAIPCACVIGKGSIIAGTGAGLPLAIPVGTNGQILIPNNTTSTGLQWINNPAILCCVLTGRGSLLTATGSSTPADLPVGTNGQVLVACSLRPQGLSWIDNPALLCCNITGKGAIITGTGPSAPTALPAGGDGQILAACSSCTSGLAWISASTSAIPCACVISKGALVTGTNPGAPAGLAPGDNGTTLTACSSCPLGLTWSIPVTDDIPCACITQKGALITGTGAGSVVSLPPGSNNQVLTVNSACPAGIGWVNSAGIPCSFITGKGSLITGITAGVPASFAPGGDGQYLVACASAACGLSWATPSGVPCSCYTDKGVLLGGTGVSTMTALPPGQNGQLLYAFSSSATGLLWANPAYIPCSIITSKGSLITANAAGIPISQVVGGDGQTLVACSTCASGLAWQTPSTVAAIPCACITAKGTIVAGAGPNVPVPVAVGGDGQFLTACAACTAGVAWTANQAVPCACITAKGTIIAGSGPNAPASVAIGTDGQILAACSSCAAGVAWITATTDAIPCACITAKGTIVAGSGPNAPSPVAIGTDGQILAACAACTAGVAWITSSTNAIPCACITAKGTIVAGSGPNDPSPVAIGTDGQLLAACSACTAGVAWITSSTNAIPCACITAKGTIVAGSGPDAPSPVAIGTDGQILTANSACATGVAWSENTAIPCACLTEKGTLITASAPSTVTALPVGANGSVLVADSACEGGMRWSSPGAGDTPVGAVEWFAMATPPAGWLVSDGRAVERARYNVLFDTIGTTYGSGDGSTTFNLPDLRGLWIRGWDAAGGVYRGCDPGRAFGSMQCGSVESHCHIVSTNDSGALVVAPQWTCPVLTSTPAEHANPSSSIPVTYTDGYTNPYGCGVKNTVDNIALLPCIKWEPTYRPDATSDSLCCAFVTWNTPVGDTSCALYCVNPGIWTVSVSGGICVPACAPMQVCFQLVWGQGGSAQMLACSMWSNCITTNQFSGGGQVVPFSLTGSAATLIDRPVYVCVSCSGVGGCSFSYYGSSLSSAVRITAL